MDIIDRFDGEHRFLSNFYPAQVLLDGVVYPSAEHAFQAAKTTDESLRREILCCDTPGKAKQKGRRLPLRSDWETIKISVMEKLIHDKFLDPALRQKLIATGDAILVEGNWWGDTFWGICNKEGENHLGRILMRERDKINGENI